MKAIGVSRPSTSSKTTRYTAAFTAGRESQRRTTRPYVTSHVTAGFESNCDHLLSDSYNDVKNTRD